MAIRSQDVSKCFKHEVGRKCGGAPTRNSGFQNDIGMRRYAFMPSKVDSMPTLPTQATPCRRQPKTSSDSGHNQSPFRPLLCDYYPPVSSCKHSPSMSTQTKQMNEKKADTPGVVEAAQDAVEKGNKIA